MENAPEALASKISPVNGTCGQRGAVLLSLHPPSLHPPSGSGGSGTLTGGLSRSVRSQKA